MAQRPRELALQYSLLVKPRLAEIWRWNAERYDEAHATKYVEFLEQHTRTLKSEYLRGRAVPDRPSYRYITIKTRVKGHGYVVVYQIRETEIFIFYYFHTAQDWLTELKVMLTKE
jgi:plasmid stabilization system protein ParE